MVKNVLEKENQKRLKEIVSCIIDKTDFSKLYDYDKNLFSIGYDVRENKLVDSYYDLLASEARLASFVAIAKRDIPYKHWFCLGRTLTTLNGYKGLVSWAGTMFEYFMPYIVMPSFDYSLLEETYRFALYSQKEYAKKLNIPWGISESAFNLQDLNYNYQYKAFGIPWLGLKRGLKEEVVVSPYSSIMTIEKDYKGVLKNIDEFRKIGAYGEYGFYESIDYTPYRVEKNKRFEIVKTYMAHHQALILLSINNFLNKNILQKNFSENPEITTVEILLEEKNPQRVVFTKEKKEKINVLKYKDYEAFEEKVINKPNGNVNIMSNGEHTLVINDFGEGYSKKNDIYITKYNESYKQANVIYIKDKKENVYWSNTLKPTKKEPDEYYAIFSPSESKFYRRDGNIEVVTRIAVSSEENVEVKQVEIKNIGDDEINIDVVSYAEVILTEKNNDIVHPVYNSLFLCASEMLGKVMIEKRFQNGEKVCFTNFATCDDENIKFEIELDKSKIIGRGRSVENPIIVEENKMFSNDFSSVANTGIAIKSNVTIAEGGSLKINYYMGVGSSAEQVKNIIEKYSKKGSEKTLMEMAMSRSLIENRFIGLKGKNINLYNSIFSEISNGSKTRYFYEDRIIKNSLNQRDLWKFGISGDLPIVLVKIKNVNDVFVVRELINAIEYFLLKNIKVDLIIIDEEKGEERYVNEKIMEYIYSKNISFLIGANGGIHILNKGIVSEAEMNLLYSCCDVVLDAKDSLTSLYTEEV